MASLTCGSRFSQAADYVTRAIDLLRDSLVVAMRRFQKNQS